MIPVSTKYRQLLIAGNRNYLIKVDITLADETVLHLTNQHIWEQGIVVDQAISSDSSFDIGSAIVGSLKVVIDNINGDFSQYDFFNAKLVLWLGVEGDLDEYDVQRYYRIGFYTVDVPSYNGSLITLECLDNMTWFDVPFSEVVGVTYPTTAGALVNAICTHVSVILGTQTFPNYTTAISAPPANDLNCREVLSYIAQMCCCYCKITTAGELALKWYDKTAITGLTDYDGGTYNTTTTPYSDGDEVDGGRYYWDGDTYVWEDLGNYNGGTFEELRDSAYISQNYQMEVSTDDVVVTGCRVCNTSAQPEEAYDELWVDAVVEQTHDRYVLVIDNNPFITKSNAGTIANTVGNILAGLPIRGYSATSLSDFSYETGDMARIIDFRGNRYYSWITKFTFTTNNSEQFGCGVESAKTRSESRYSKTIVEAKAVLTAYDQAVKAMDELAQNAIGYNEYTYGTPKVMWRYNGTVKDVTDPADPKFPDSTVVFKISGDGVFVSNSIDPVTGAVTYTNGYDANSGTALLNLIYTIGLYAEWIKADTLSAITAKLGTVDCGGSGTGGGINGSLRVFNASNQKKVELNNDGLWATAGTIGGFNIGTEKLGFRGSPTSMDAGEIAKDGTFAFSHGYDGSWTRFDFNSGSNSLGLWTAGSGHSGGGIDVSGGAPGDYNATWVRWGWSDGQRSDNYYVSWYSGSDKRLKKNIKSLEKSKVRQFFEKLNPIRFNYNKKSHADTEKQHYGVIAQEVEELLEDVGEKNTYFIEDKDVLVKDKDGNESTVNYKYVHYEEFHGWELAAIKDLYEQVNELKEEVALLKQKVGE